MVYSLKLLLWVSSSNNNHVTCRIQAVARDTTGGTGMFREGTADVCRALLDSFPLGQIVRFGREGRKRGTEGDEEGRG